MNRALFIITAALIAVLGLHPISLAQAPEPATPKPAPPTQDSSTATGTTPTTPRTDYDAERLKIWNSPEMMEAREWVRDHARRSVRFTPQDAEIYLARLRQMSPSQMQEWLRRYHAKQASIARSVEVSKAARQRSIARAQAWHQNVRQSYANIKLGQDQASLMARNQYELQQFAAGQRAADIDVVRDARVASRLDNDFSWLLFPTPNQKKAAMMSLPGNLPPGDPRNFIRGDVPGPGDGVGVVEPDPRGDGVPPDVAPDVRR
jgi:hypothetical protein